jgi:hypothetical protein
VAQLIVRRIQQRDTSRRTLAAGCNVREVSEWAGHNGVAFTRTRYGGLFEDNADAAIDRLDAFLGNSSMTEFRALAQVRESAGRPITS